ncbi:hypothetical protein MKK68_00040 [Methylobacterium sp. E-016]|nr:hypothetical protein [Methylobacterium sp. E-016]
MPPQPPVMVQERVWQSPGGAAQQRLAQRLADDYDARATAWLARMDNVKAEAEEISSLGLASPDDLATMDNIIEEYEAHADVRALFSSRLVKRIRREVKAMFEIDPSVAAAARDGGNRLIATDKKIVEALLDYALFLRALRAEGSGEAHGGPTFDNADDLQRHLDSLAA